MTERASLELCNLTSRGMTLKEARKHLADLGKEKAPKDDKPKKLSATEKKELLTEQIEAAGGEAPDMKESVAKFEEALTAAKAAIVEREQAEAEAAQEVADAAQEAADKEKAEAEDAEADLM